METKIIAGYQISLYPLLYYKIVFKNRIELEFLISLN
jgi:hypothetical protein